MGLHRVKIYGLKLTAEPIPTPVVSLAEAKTFLVVNHNEHNSMIEGMIHTATADIEDYTRRSLFLRAHTVTLVDVDGDFELPRPPIATITSVNTDYTEIASGLIRISGKDVEIKYQAGYLTTPEPLKQAVLNQLPMYYTQSQMAEGLRVNPDSNLVFQSEAAAQDFVYHYNTI